MKSEELISSQRYREKKGNRCNIGTALIIKMNTD